MGQSLRAQVCLGGKGEVNVNQAVIERAGIWRAQTKAVTVAEGDVAAGIFIEQGMMKKALLRPHGWQNFIWGFTAG